jgi:hypothetical protein
MKKLAISSLVVAGLLGATGIASAQMNAPTSGASSQGNVGPNNTLPSTPGTTGMAPGTGMTGTGAGTAAGSAAGGPNNAGSSNKTDTRPAGAMAPK